MPKRIKLIEDYQCDKCDETGSYDKIKTHEEEICFADIKICKYNKFFKTEKFNRRYKMYQHNHNDFRKIQQCNQSFQSKRENLEKFKGKLKCINGHDIQHIDAHVSERDDYHSGLTFICVEPNCENTIIELDDVVIMTGYSDSFNLLKYSLDGKLDDLFF